MASKNKVKRSKRTAQSMVELALLMPVLGFALLGLIDLGRALYVYISLHSAAANTAQYVGFNYAYNSSGTTWTQIQHEAQVELTGGGAIDTSKVTVANVTRTQIDSTDTVTTSTCNDPCVAAQNDNITVTLAYSFDLITPFFGQATGGKLNIQATASSVALGGK